MQPSATEIGLIQRFKALSDLTRLRIIGLLGVPRTVKQVADLLNDDHHGYYHHMRVLRNAGIVHLVETREETHGIVERYYQLIDLPSHSYLYTPAIMAILNSGVREKIMQVVQILTGRPESLQAKSRAVHVIASIPESKLDQAAAIVGRHKQALVDELAALETGDMDSTYHVLLLHFPGGPP